MLETDAEMKSGRAAAYNISSSTSQLRLGGSSKWPDSTVVETDALQDGKEGVPEWF